MGRQASVERQTTETRIHVSLQLDGQGRCAVTTGIPFMDHMLSLAGRHGFFDWDISARGDTDIDDHHTVEDLGICLGLAVRKALGDFSGIRRYGESVVPMDETLARVVMDFSNRPYLFYGVSLDRHRSGNFDVGLLEEFFRALTVHAGLTLHVDLLRGREPHHVAEAVFKAFGRAMDQATRGEERLSGDVPSTKGLL